MYECIKGEWVNKGECEVVCKNGEDGYGQLFYKVNMSVFRDCKIDERYVSCGNIEECGDCLNGEIRCEFEKEKYRKYICKNGKWDSSGSCAVSCKDEDAGGTISIKDSQEMIECEKDGGRVSCKYGECGECLNGDIKCEDGHKNICKSGRWGPVAECVCENENIRNDNKELCLDYEWVRCNIGRWGNVVGRFACLESMKSHWYACDDEMKGEIVNNGELLCMNDSWHECNQMEHLGKIVDNVICMSDIRDAGDADVIKWVICDGDSEGELDDSEKYLCTNNEWKSCGGDKICIQKSVNTYLYSCNNNGQWGKVKCKSKDCKDC